jgi:DUF1680 family protein
MPSWCQSATLDGAAIPAGSATISRHRQWQPGDTVVFDMDMPIRVTEPHPRVDAVRGCVAVQRGPLVYCVESADVPTGVELEELRWDPAGTPALTMRPDLEDGMVGVAVALRHGERSDTVGAIPYFAWANRGAAAMRVWIPR